MGLGTWLQSTVFALAVVSRTPGATSTIMGLPPPLMQLVGSEALQMGMETGIAHVCS